MAIVSTLPARATTPVLLQLRLCAPTLVPTPTMEIVTMVAKHPLTPSAVLVRIAPIAVHACSRTRPPFTREHRVGVPPAVALILPRIGAVAKSVRELKKYD